MKKILIIFFTLFFLTNVNARTCHPEVFYNQEFMEEVNLLEYVFDFSNSIKRTDEKKLVEDMKYFYNKTNIKLVIVLDKDTRCFTNINYLDYFDYKNGFYKYYHNLVMLYINPTNNTVGIRINGIAANNIISNKEELRSYISNTLNDNNYYATANSFVEKVSSYYDNAYSSYTSDLNKYNDSVSFLEEYYSKQRKIHIQIIIMSFILSGIIVYTIISLNNNVTKKNSAYKYLKSNNFRVKKISTTLISSEIINRNRGY